MHLICSGTVWEIWINDSIADMTIFWNNAAELECCNEQTPETSGVDLPGLDNIPCSCPGETATVVLTTA